MKKVVMLVSFIIASHLVFGQQRNIKQDVLLFEKALLLQGLINDDLRLDEIIKSKEVTVTEKELVQDIKQEILLKAKKYYKEILDSFPKSKLLFMALDSKGFIELEIGQVNDAKNTFQAILDIKADGGEIEEVATNLITEPFVNYKNRAAKTLADIYYRDSNYSKSVEYLNLASKYPFSYMCGNGVATDEINTIMSYAKSYLGLKNNKKALQVLLPEIIENGFADNSELVELTYKILLLEYSRDDLKMEYEQAFKNYQKIQIKSKDENYDEYFIMFLSTKVSIDSWQLQFTSPGKISEEIHKLYRASKFYSLLND